MQKKPVYLCIPSSICLLLKHNPVFKIFVFRTKGKDKGIFCRQIAGTASVRFQDRQTASTEKRPSRLLNASDS